MIIDYSEIEQQSIDRFKGGNGLLVTRNFVDEKNGLLLVLI